MTIKRIPARRTVLALTTVAILAAGGVGAAQAATSHGTSPSLSTCTTLSTALGQRGAAAGSQYVYLRVTNTGSTTCAIQGYPYVSFENDHGILYGWPAADSSGLGGSGTPAMALAPGKAVRALFQLPDYQNFPTGYCLPLNMPKLRVSIDGQATMFTWNQTECSTRYGRTMIGAVHPL